jgi:P-type Cu2+ transporter
VSVGRANMTTRRLRLIWRGADEDANHLIEGIEALGYRLVRFETSALGAIQDCTGRTLVDCVAVAGFAAGNVMLISIGIWAGRFDRSCRTSDTGTAALGLGADRDAGDRLCRATILFLGTSSTSAAPYEYGRADQPWGSAGHRHQPYRNDQRRRPHLLRLSRHLFVLPARRPSAGSRARDQARATAEQLLALRTIDVAVAQPDRSIRHRAPVFDKTGTLTEPMLALVGDPNPEDLQDAAMLAVSSRHPIARSLVPLAIAGWVTPWLAAVAMSSPSLLMIANSLRLHRSAKL